jgi:hypothetical protein
MFATLCLSFFLSSLLGTRNSDVCHPRVGCLPPSVFLSFFLLYSELGTRMFATLKSDVCHPMSFFLSFFFTRNSELGCLPPSSRMFATLYLSFFFTRNSELGCLPPSSQMFATLYLSFFLTRNSELG